MHSAFKEGSIGEPQHTLQNVFFCLETKYFCRVGVWTLLPYACTIGVVGLNKFLHKLLSTELQNVQCTQQAARESQTAEEQNRLDIRNREHVYCICVCVCVCVYIYIDDDVSFAISPAWRHI